MAIICWQRTTPFSLHTKRDCMIYSGIYLIEILIWIVIGTTCCVCSFSLKSAISLPHGRWEFFWSQKLKVGFVCVVLKDWSELILLHIIKRQYYFILTAAFLSMYSRWILYKTYLRVYAIGLCVTYFWVICLRLGYTPGRDLYQEETFKRGLSDPHTGLIERLLKNPFSCQAVSDITFHLFAS